MTVLSDSSILGEVMNGVLGIEPFNDKHLQPAGYDIMLAEDVLLYPQGSGGRAYTLASSIETFRMPPHIMGEIFGRSSVARLFVMVHVVSGPLEPGWTGQLTFELVNLSEHRQEFKRGDRIAQIKFSWLDHPTSQPYSGRYQEQFGITPSKFKHGDL